MIFNLPADTSIAPVNRELPPLNVNALLADVFFDNVPEPEIAPDNV